MAKVKWNDAALGRVIGTSEAAVRAVEERTSEIAASANALSAGFRTGRYHRDHESPAVGGTQPAYAHDTRMFRNSVVGMVHTGNYAAMKDNHQNNTLLKAVG